MQMTGSFGYLPIFAYFQTSNYVIFHATKASISTFNSMHLSTSKMIAFIGSQSYARAALEVTHGTWMLKFMERSETSMPTRGAQTS